jgi:hypothetical protein
MGLFSKTKTYVESTTVGLFAETRGTITQTVLNATVQDRSISDDLITNSLNGLGRKSKVFYRYGRDTYTYGLPEGSMEVKHASNDAVGIVIKSILDDTAEVVFSVYGIADSDMFAREFLVNTRQWDEESNVISNPSFTTTETVTLYTTEWLSNTQIRIFYLYDGEENLETEDITVEPVNIDKGYYHVGYVTDTSPDVVLYWFYEASEGTYETLNVIDTEYQSTYFPVVPIIRDNVDMTADSLKDTELYQTSKKLLDKMGIDFVKIGEGVQENPDIDAVDHAYINVSAPIQSDSKNVQKYLYEHFLDLYNKQEYDVEYFNNWEDSLGGFTFATNPFINRVIVKETENDSLEIGNFHTELGFLYITSETITGSLGKVGTVTRETVIKDPITGRGYSAETSYMLWNKQVNETQYRQLKVVGLKHVNYIYKSKHIDTSLEDSLSEDNDDFNIMVNYEILQKFNVNQKSDILNDTLRIVLNSVERIKLKWYQTSAFRVLVIIVAAVLTVLFPPASGLYAWAIAATGATLFAIQLAIAILINSLLSIAVGKLVDVIGAENFAILELLYTIYAVSQGDFTTITADDVIFIANGIARAGQYYFQDAFAEVANEYDQMVAEQEADQAELDELVDALPIKFLDPLTLLNVGGNLLEYSSQSAEQYYTTSIHTGNIGTIAFQEASRYVEAQLKLPGVDDREGLNIL